MKSIEKDEPLRTAVRAFFARHKIEQGKKILSALSGGPDSTALALVLVSLRDELGVSVEIGHYDHGIRSGADSERELEFVRRFAGRFSLPLRTGRAGAGVIEERARTLNRSLEAEAREYRYRFLLEAGHTAGCDYIALGHTREDRQETQVYRFFQGGSCSGLEGIRERRGNILRPLLGMEKKEILAFLNFRNEEYCVDPSNDSYRFLRNEIRGRLMPVVKEVFPGYSTALDKMSLKAGLYNDFVEKSLIRSNPWKRSGQCWECGKKEFLGLHPVLRIQSLYDLYACDRPSRNEKRIPFSFFLPVIKDENFSKNHTLLRGHEARLVIGNDRLFWKSDIVLERKKGYLYRIDGPTDIIVAGMLRIRVEETQRETSSAEDVFPCGEDGFLILRSRRQGDAMPTACGHTSLKKLLADRKIPESLRDTVPVLQNSRNIIGLLLRPFAAKTVRTLEEGSPGPGKAKYLRFIAERTGDESG